MLVMTQQMFDFFEEVTATLGGTLVDVELTENDLYMCFKKAKRTFQQKGHNSYRREFMVLPVIKGTPLYTIPSDIDTIVKVIKPGTGWSLEDAFSVVAYNDMFSTITSGTQGIDFLSYELVMGQMDRLKRIAAFDAQFHHDKFRNTLTFFKTPDRDASWLVECYRNLTDDEYSKIDWIIRWTVAEAKEMLGIAYRKFGSLPGPTGETNLSGSEYIQEAKQEKEQLLEDILNGVDGEGDYMEIVMG